jgi:nucleoside-diphosphate-sugar epimerase
MRVFVTGATGFIGSAVVKELLATGHSVLGLCRSRDKAKALAAAGAEVFQGSLEDTDSLKQGAARAEGVIHTAFNHDFSRFAENCELDRRAIEVIGAELEGSQRPLLVTGGIGFLAKERPGTEADVPPSPSAAYPRASEAAAMALAEKGVRVTTVRLPQVHDRDRHGLVSGLVAIARDKGVSAYVGDGSARWSAVHRLDAARVYRLALEHDTRDGPWHAITEEQGVPLKDIAEVIGRRLNVPVVSMTPENAKDHFGWFAPFAAADLHASSKRTRERLGWTPSGQPGLLDDLEHASYFLA